jgi:hypothetical protein
MTGGRGAMLVDADMFENMRGKLRPGFAMNEKCGPTNVETSASVRGHQIGKADWQRNVGGQDHASSPEDLVNETTPEVEEKRTGTDQQAAGAEWDVVRHDFIPRLGWRVMGATRRPCSLSART